MTAEDHYMSQLTAEIIAEDTEVGTRQRNSNALIECINSALINLDNAALFILRGGFHVEDSFRLAYAVTQDLFNKIEEEQLAASRRAKLPPGETAEDD